jgi:UDP-2-acetamido-3-amino-2,3-dideoxy-glucuronate N-acetyltransferase
MIHKSSDVQTNNIGKNTKVWQYSIILSGAAIGNNCNINAHCLIENKVVLGNNVTIKCGNYIWDGITIEDNVFVGPNVTFTNDFVPRSGNSNFKLHETLLKEGCSVGGGATILPGLSIGRFAMIGAGSLITKNVGDFELWFGNPASHKGYVTKNGVILSKDLICKKTGLKYILNNHSEPILLQ